jgi:YHS domain-containing protein
VDSMISFLLFAVFFYFMMRFGCGSHKTHGHHSHSKADKAEPIIDPVCGKVVEQEQGYGKLHQGVLYRFCSKKCLDEFDLDQEKYIINTKEKGPSA